jgi:intracellular multiplication protein IcmV
MAVKDVFKVSRKTFFNPSAWLGSKEIMAYNRIIIGSIKGLFSPAKPQRVETFEAAMQRLKLTEADIQQTARQYFLFVMLFVILSMTAFIVSFYYLFHHGTFAGWLLAMSVAILFASQAFRYDFWRFQMTQRRLGCTFKEWRQATWGGAKGPQE